MNFTECLKELKKGSVDNKKPRTRRPLRQRENFAFNASPRSVTHQGTAADCVAKSWSEKISPLGRTIALSSRRRAALPSRSAVGQGRFHPCCRPTVRIFFHLKISPSFGPESLEHDRQNHSKPEGNTPADEQRRPRGHSSAGSPKAPPWIVAPPQQNTAPQPRRCSEAKRA